MNQFTTNLGPQQGCDELNGRFADLYSGWVQADETWTYAGANSFMVSGDKTGKYQKGDKIKLTQTTVKYFYLTAISYYAGTGLTTCIVNGGSDYTLVNAQISNNYYSKVQNPHGFPDWFNFACTQTGFSANPTSAVYRFKIQGNHCITVVHQGTNGTSNSTAFSMTAPVIAKTISNMVWEVFAYAHDNGAVINGGVATIVSGGTSFIVLKGGSATAWTGSAGKRASFQISYEI